MAGGRLGAGPQQRRQGLQQHALQVRLGCTSNIHLQLHLYDAIVTSTALSSCEVWGVHPAAQQQWRRLAALHRRYIRRICRCRREEHRKFFTYTRSALCVAAACAAACQTRGLVACSACVPLCTGAWLLEEFEINATAGCSKRMNNMAYVLPRISSALQFLLRIAEQCYREPHIMHVLAWGEAAHVASIGPCRPRTCMWRLTRPVAACRGGRGCC